MKSPTAWAWIVLIAAPWLLLYDYFTLMWSFPEYRFFPALLLLAIWLIFERWDRQLHGVSALRLAWVAVGIACTVFAMIIWSPWLGMLGWLCFCGAWLWGHFDKLNGKRLAGIWILLLLLLRLPVHLDVKLTAYLQEKTSRLSSFILDWLEVIHFRNGNVFELAHGPLFVETACSGVQSLFAMLFIASLVVVWRGGSIWLWPVYLLAGFFWAGFLNICRIATIALAQEWYGVDLAHGWKHDALGYLCLLIAFGLMLATDRLIQVFFYEAPPDELGKYNPINRLWNLVVGAKKVTERNRAKEATKYMKSPLIAMAATMILVIIGQPLLRPSKTPVSSSETKKEAIWEPSKDLFGSINDLQIANHVIVRGGEDITLGDNSDVWDALVNGVNCRIAVSHPYNEFHEMTVCYEAIGWELNERKVKLVDDWGYVAATFRGDNGREALLLFSGVSRSGAALNPPDASMVSLAAGRWQSFFKKDVIEYRNIMIQLWITTNEPLSDETKQALEDVHARIRTIVKKSLEGAQ